MPHHYRYRSNRPGWRRLILASGSPRRRQLIKAIDLPLRIVGSGDDEPDPDAGESPRLYVQRLAMRKAKFATKMTRDDIVLGADTSVAIDGLILGKPASASEAVQMLQLLRGSIHEVVTGIAILDTETGICSTSARVSKVCMRQYSDNEIARYVESGEPFDKAGAYAAQDPSFKPAERIYGCYANVIGLPVCDVLTLLDRIGVPTTFRLGWQIYPGCADCDYWAAQTAAKKGARRV